MSCMGRGTIARRGNGGGVWRGRYPSPMLRMVPLPTKMWGGNGVPKPAAARSLDDNRSPAAISADPVALSVSIDPSTRSTQLRPGNASPPPASPRGAIRRRLASMFARIGSRNVSSRTTPSPP